MIEEKVLDLATNTRQDAKLVVMDQQKIEHQSHESIVRIGSNKLEISKADLISESGTVRLSECSKRINEVSQGELSNDALDAGSKSRGNSSARPKESVFEEVKTKNNGEKILLIDVI